MEEDHESSAIDARLHLTSIRISCETGSVRVASQELSHPFLKTLAAIYPDTADNPWVSEHGRRAANNLLKCHKLYGSPSGVVQCIHREMCSGLLINMEYELSTFQLKTFFQKSQLGLESYESVGKRNEKSFIFRYLCWRG